MPAPVFYTPPAVRRYFGLANDPNTAVGGTNLENLLVDSVNFPGAVIPDVTNVWPVTGGDVQWGASRINRDNEVRGIRPGVAEIPFKVNPMINFTVDSYRYTAEKLLKSVMGVEGLALGNTAYEVDSVAITGAPTGGTFTLTFTWGGNIYTTAAVAFNATAAAVAGAVQAAAGTPALPATSVTGSGGPLPASAVTLTFTGGISGPVTVQSANSAGLTGGTTPTATFTRTTQGVTPTAYAHPLSFAPFGAGLLPSLNLQIIRDSINHKSIGNMLESVELTFPFDGPGTAAVESHPLYLRQELGSVALPTGVIPEVAAQPMMIRDASVVFDGGATSTIGISGFHFGVKNNAQYNRQVAGRCIDQKTLGTPPLLRQLWFPYYHKISGRHKVTWGLDFLDTNEGQEIATEWGQIQKIVVTVADPLVATNSIVFSLFATEINGGGATSALVAEGDQTSVFSGNAYYSASDGTDVSVQVNNTTATAI